MPRPVRFFPDPLDSALVAFSSAQDFVPEQVALIVDEAPRNGCSLVLRPSHAVADGQTWLVQVGRMDPVPAKVVWHRVLEASLVRVGLEYLA